MNKTPAGKLFREHGISCSPSYRSWSGCRDRCYNTNYIEYEYYGGRGITVCERWLEVGGQGFVNFLGDMGERPEGMTLDRINVDGHYCKENCRWASLSDQSFNKRTLKTNTTGKTGVYKTKQYGHYTAMIGVKRELIYLGYYILFEDAIKAREEAEMKYYGYLKHGSYFKREEFND